MENQIFSLDIGTRSVTGIILEEHSNQKYKVIDYYTKEHKERAMVDGQIHDIISVSDIINDVRNKLEEKNGPLGRVCVAAAGRSLKTIEASASIRLDQQPIGVKQTVKHLELSAVQKAQELLVRSDSNGDYSSYYCVGYSVLHYELDDDKIGSLIDQRGEVATVYIIATFLPKVVVESLLTALERSSLEMEALTLEPIAAIEILIPESMRRLNVALVDIGAGTSDIAVTDQGTITAYGMVPFAGDKITEAISDHYLLDFPIAEQMKRNVITNQKDVVQDILGFETTITIDELMDQIDDKVNTLASLLAEEIIRLNHNPPKAIMLIGGGSLTPTITEKLAEKLQLPANRVAVRGIEAIQNLETNEQLPKGPDFITPIGIAIAARKNPVHYINVNVNDQQIRMFKMKELTVGDCLIQAGIEINKLYGLPGLAAIVSINNENITLPGKLGKLPKILINNEPGTVDDLVSAGDVISITRGTNGNTPKVSLGQLLNDTETLSIKYEDKTYTLEPKTLVNNEVQQAGYIVKDKDKIVIKQPRTIEEFLAMEHLDEGSSKPFFIELNNRMIHLNTVQAHLYINDKRVEMSQVLRNGDHIKFVPAKQPMISDLLQQLRKSFHTEVSVHFNDKLIQMKQPLLTITRNNKKLAEDTVLHPNDQLKMTELKTKRFIFQDVFRYVDIDLSKVTGHFELYKNNIPTTFYEHIQHGDHLSIKWGEKMSS